MTWLRPIPYTLVPTHDSDSFGQYGPGHTGLPLFPHKGAFAVPRKFHVHEGVDLYVPEGTAVCAVEAGTVVDIQPFTGLHADTPWWEETWAVLVQGGTGVVVYGEIVPRLGLELNMHVPAGELLGRVKRVLKVDKGRPVSMLHLELHTHGTRVCPAWERHAEPPSTLRDPTPYLSDSVSHRTFWTGSEGECDGCGCTIGWVGHAGGCPMREV